MIRNLFPRYQKEILTFCNTDFGKEWLQDKGEKIETGDQVIKISPDGVHVLKDLQDGKLVVQATFYPRSPYINKFDQMLESLRVAEEAKFLPQVQKEIYSKPIYFYTHPFIYFDSLTVNPNANPESTSVDGTVTRNGTNESFSTIRSGAGTSSTDYSTTFIGNLSSGNSSNGWNELDRGIILFDTSSLTAQATKVSAVLSLYGQSKNDVFNLSWNIYTSTPASNTALVSSDYGQTGTTAQCDTAISTASFSTSAYNNWTLNSTGLGNVSLTSVSKFSYKSVSDATNSSPTWSSLADGYAIPYSSDNGSNKPKLVVTYTLPSGGTLLFFR